MRFEKVDADIQVLPSMGPRSRERGNGWSVNRSFRAVKTAVSERTLVHHWIQSSIFTCSFIFHFVLPPWTANRDRQAHFRYHIAARNSHHGYSVKELSI